MVGLSQERLAKRIEVGDAQVCKYETGIDRITAGRLYEIAHALGVDVSYFFAELEESCGTESVALEGRTLELTKSFMNMRGEREKRAFLALSRVMTQAEPDTVAEGDAPD